MSYAENFFTKLSHAQEVINKANEEKAHVIDNFLEDIKNVCHICYELWDEKEEKILEQIKVMEQKYSFKFPYDYNDVLNKDRIVRSICECFPVYNYAQENIMDSLPQTNEQWYVANESTEDLIKIDVQPYNQHSRYPQNPEENQEAFYYIMPRVLHDKLLKADNDVKKNLIEEYMNEKISAYLKEVEEKIKVKADIVKKTIANIDFNDPAIVAELKSKLRM